MAFETPASQHGDEGKKRKQKQDDVVIKSVNMEGRPEECLHPSIIGQPSAPDGVFHEADQVLVHVPNLGETTMSFSDYLLMIGAYDKNFKVIYGLYYKLVQLNPGMSSQEILEGLHRHYLEERIKTVRSQEPRNEKLDRRGEDARHQTVVEGKILSACFADLGIDGLDASVADVRHDDLEEVDELICFDHEKLISNGERESLPIYVGVQRTKRPDKALRSRANFLPEHAEYGLIFKVLVLEATDRYWDKDGMELFQTWMDLKNKRYGTESAKFPPVREILPGKGKEAASRVLVILRAIRQQMQDFINSSKFSKLSAFQQATLSRQFTDLHLDDFITAVEEEQKMAA